MKVINELSSRGGAVCSSLPIHYNGIESGYHNTSGQITPQTSERPIPQFTLAHTHQIETVLFYERTTRCYHSKYLPSRTVSDQSGWEKYDAEIEHNTAQHMITERSGSRSNFFDRAGTSCETVVCETRHPSHPGFSLAKQMRVLCD